MGKRGQLGQSLAGQAIGGGVLSGSSVGMGSLGTQTIGGMIIDPPGERIGAILPGLTTRGPASCNSSDTCTFSLDIAAGLVVQVLGLAIKNLQRAQGAFVWMPPGSGIFSGPTTIDVPIVFNTTLNGATVKPLNCLETNDCEAFFTVIDFADAITKESPTHDFQLTRTGPECPVFTITLPPLCKSGDVCTFTIRADRDLLITGANLFIKNLAKGTEFFLPVSLPTTPHNLALGLSRLTTLNGEFVNIGDFLPAACGDTDAAEVRWFLAGTGFSPASAFGLRRTRTVGPLDPCQEECIRTGIRLFSHSVAATFDCIGTDGRIVVQGKLVQSSGLLCIEDIFPHADVHIGLQDPAEDPLTGPMFDYVVNNTGEPNLFGGFGANFNIDARPDVVQLVPLAGQRQFRLLARFEGDGVHSRTAAFANVTLRGREADPCFLGTLVRRKDFEPAPAGETIHEVTVSYAARLLGATLEIDIAEAMSKAEQAMIGAGAHPVRIEVFRGPDIPVFTFFGLTAATPTFSIRTFSWGSPVPVALIAVAILAVIALFILWQIALVVRDIVSIPGGAASLVALAIAGIAAVGVGGYYLVSRRGRRST